jgi:hypothetical protein
MIQRFLEFILFFMLGIWSASYKFDILPVVSHGQATLSTLISKSHMVRQLYAHRFQNVTWLGNFMHTDFKVSHG